MGSATLGQVVGLHTGHTGAVITGSFLSIGGIVLQPLINKTLNRNKV
ncbi:MAG: hypothetical protein ACPHSA_06245 [Cycloclasticus pugetii]|nr:hypothetical protein [Cycloclasticus pugetii]